MLLKSQKCSGLSSRVAAVAEQVKVRLTCSSGESIAMLPTAAVSTNRALHETHDKEHAPANRFLPHWSRNRDYRRRQRQRMGRLGQVLMSGAM